jgi:hypothetical protein
MTRQRAIRLAIVVFSLAGYVWLSYFTVRTNFVKLVSIYFLLFGLYLLILRGKIFDSNFKIAIGAALLFRVSLLFMTPNLTDDYFRFIWDGLFFANGYNPYLIMPSAFIKGSQTVPGISMALYEHLNSPNYYSVYPPVCQFIFGLSAKICGGNTFGNVILMRIFIMLAEFGSIALLCKLAKIFRSPPACIFIYAFNPLVIIELTGNLHFEAMMIFFLLLAVYLLVKEQQIYSAISFAVAIGTKLMPIIFLPLLIKRIGLGRSSRYFAIVVATLLLLFLPFLNTQSIQNFLSSLSLYFRVFEFNASIYYLVRWIGYQIAGYNIIAISGVILLVISFFAIITIAFREKATNWQSLFSSMLLCLTVYLLCATTVHPWYLTPLIMLSVFTRYRYALVWSLLVMLTYATYQTVPYSENLWLVTIEYLAVGGWMAYEMLPRLIVVRSR